MTMMTNMTVGQLKEILSSFHDDEQLKLCYVDGNTNTDLLLEEIVGEQRYDGVTVILVHI